MKKQISSDATVIWKYLFPGLWIPVTGVWAIAAAVDASEESVWILLMLGWIIASSYLIWFARRLKVVSIDEEFIYVSQSRKEVQIPLAHIQKVTENFLGNPKLITLTLNQPSELGTKIVFVPKFLVFAALRSHPIVKDIKTAVRRCRSTH